MCSVTYSGLLHYPLLRINDLADENAMLEFSVIDWYQDVFELCFLGRMKG